jgi:hypothetical protein
VNHPLAYILLYTRWTELIANRNKFIKFIKVTLVFIFALLGARSAIHGPLYQQALFSESNLSNHTMWNTLLKNYNKITFKILAIWGNLLTIIRPTFRTDAAVYILCMDKRCDAFIITCKPRDKTKLVLSRMWNMVRLNNLYLQLISWIIFWMTHLVLRSMLQWV